MPISELLTLLTSPPDRYISVSDAIPVRDFRENLFNTPGFEAAQDAAIMTWGAGETGDTTGLTNDPESTDFKFGGSSTKSFRFMAAGDNASTGQFYAIAAADGGGFIPIVGVTYTFSGYIFIPIGSPLTSIGVGIRDNFSYGYVSNSQSELMVPLTPGQWTRFSVSAVGGGPKEGGGNSYSWLFSVADPNGTYATATWYLDNTMVEIASSALTYFDGATPNSAWEGGANTSTSLQTLVNIGITYIPINVETIDVGDAVTVSFSGSGPSDLNISVSDTSTPGETRTITNTQLGNRSVSDTSTPGETRTITNTQLGNISVSDTSTPGEVVTINISSTSALTISVSDTSTPGEVVTITNTQLGNISVSDTSTPGETRTITNTQLGNISVSDTSTPGETRTITNTQLGNISVSDTLTLGETRTAAATLANISKVDSITTTEYVRRKNPSPSTASFGVNYKSLDNADADIAYFRTQGITTVRIDIPVYDTWVGGDWVLFLDLANKFYEAGFYVIYGISGEISATYTWAQFAADAEDAAAEAEGKCSEFTLGNEMDSSNDDGYISDATLRSNLRSLATTVKGIFSGVVSYATIAGTSTDSYGSYKWAQEGKGGYDKISLNIYGQADNPFTTFISSYTDYIPYFFKTFGSDAYISEFNLDGGDPVNFAGIPDDSKVYLMKWMEAYIRNWGITGHTLYTWRGFKDTNNDYAVKQIDNTLLPMWDVFSISNLNNSAYLFRSDGNTQNVYITPYDHTPLQIGAVSDYSIGAKVLFSKKTVSGNDDNHTIANCDFNWGGDTGYLFQVGSADGHLEVYVGTTSYSSSTGVFAYDTWQYVAFTITGTTLKGYVNGSLVWTQTLSSRKATGGTTDSKIGAESPGFREFKGYMKDFWAVKSLLDSTQINNIMSASYPTLDLHYQINEGISYAAIDTSGNSNFGLYNEPNWVIAPGVTDSISIGDTPLVSLGSDRVISKSDTSTPGEVVTITNTQLGNISVSDTSTPGETRTITNTQLGNISVSDTSTPGETRTITNTQLGNISVSDTSTPGETRTITNTQLGNISVSDTSTLGETRTITNTQLGNISVSDTSTPGEVVTINISSPGALTVSVSDTSTPGEVVTITNTQLGNISVSDTSTPGETRTITNTQLGNISVSDTSTPGEVVTITNTQLGNISVSDTSTPGETRTITNTQLGNISVSDTSTPGEIVTMRLFSLISVSDTSTPGETRTITNTQLGNISVSDTATPGETRTVTNTQLGNISVSDTSTPGDAASISVSGGTILISATETIVIGDTIPNNEDRIIIGESVTVTMGASAYSISVSDVVKPVDDKFIADSYSEANYDSASFMSGGALWVQGMGQSFTAIGGDISSVKFYLYKVLSPTGNAVAKIYAHSGTFGSSSLPTGSALATSDNFNVSTLGSGSGNIALIEFSFSGANKIALTQGTKYFITVEYSGGDNTNYIGYGIDTTASTHSGNGAFYASSTWQVTASDRVFYVYETPSSYPAVIVTNTQLGNISVSDTSTPGEAVTVTGSLQISKTDTITIGDIIPDSEDRIIIGEVVTVSVSGAFFSISVSDTSTSGETRTITNTQLGNISVSDTSTSGETVTMRLFSLISVSDTSTPGETRTITNTQLGNISVSDTSTPGEAITVNISSPSAFTISVSDTVTPGEARTITNTQLGNISVSDTKTIGETVTPILAGTTFVVSVSDTFSMVDGIPQLGESITIGEGITMVARVISVSDTLTPGEAVTVTNTQLGGVSISSDSLVIFEDLGQSYLPNGDFEYAPAFVAAQTTSGRWIDGTASGSATVQPYRMHASFGGAAGDRNAQFDSANPYTGNNSLKIHTNSGAYAELRTSAVGYFGTYGMRLRPNTSYQYSFWMKSENVSGSGGGQNIQLLFSNSAGGNSNISSPGGGTVSEFNATGGITTNKVWTNYTGTFTTGSTTVWYHPEFRVYGHNGAATLAGDFWFDDCFVTPVIPDQGKVELSSNLNLSESQTIGESITTSREALNISLSDSIITTEQVTLTVFGDRTISVADSLSIGETVTARTTLANISVSDTLGATEVVNVTKILNVAVSDAITTTERIIISTIRYAPGRRHHGEVSPELITYGTAGHKLNRF